MTLNGRLYYPQVLIISGSGKHVGKTTLACTIINKLSLNNNVVALKISSHFHPVNYDQPVYELKDQFSIYEERSSIPAEDSSKMKKAGASKVYYIQSTRDNIEKAFLKSMEYIKPHWPVVCESLGLLDFVRPGLSIIVKKADKYQVKSTIDPESIELINDGDFFENFISKISYNSGQWRLNQFN